MSVEFGDNLPLDMYGFHELSIRVANEAYSGKHKANQLPEDPLEAALIMLDRAGEAAKFSSLKLLYEKVAADMDTEIVWFQDGI